jgi:hypothetical protein
LHFSSASTSISADSARHRFGERRVSVLATLAIHLLLVFTWCKVERQPARPAGPADEAVSVRLYAPKLPKVEDKVSKMWATPIRVVKVPRIEDPVGAAPVDDKLVAPVDKAAPAIAAAAVDDPFAPPQSVHERAVAQAGKVDRELRGNKKLVLSLQPDSFQAKLAAGIAAAHKGDMMAKVDHYTSPDGVIYTRMKRGSETRCYMNGSINFVPGILHDSAKPQRVNCPPDGSGWRG